jgi:hypothetical protein
MHANFIKLSKSIGQLKALSSLSLYFSFRCSMTNKSIPELMKGLKELKNFSSLSLYFPSCDWLVGLNKGIKELKTLSSLYLNFGWCPSLTNADMIEFGRSLIKLKELKSVSLKCDHLTP